MYRISQSDPLTDFGKLRLKKRVRRLHKGEEEKYGQKSEGLSFQTEARSSSGP